MKTDPIITANLATSKLVYFLKTPTALLVIVSCFYLYMLPNTALVVLKSIEISSIDAINLLKKYDIITSSQTGTLLIIMSIGLSIVMELASLVFAIRGKHAEAVIFAGISAISTMLKYLEVTSNYLSFATIVNLFFSFLPIIIIVRIASIFAKSTTSENETDIVNQVYLSMESKTKDLINSDFSKKSKKMF